jgi:predicted nucleotidyltransferase
LANIPDKIIELLKNYINSIELNDKIHIKSAFLFGSYAKGNYNEWSDIDIAIISDNFEGIRIFDKDKIRKTTLKIDHRISPLPFKTEDFDPSDLFVHEILSSGIKIV